MFDKQRIEFLLVTLLIAVGLTAGCFTSARSRYFGNSAPPGENVLRYVTGSEPETFDPQVSTGQPEARIYMALYEGLVEYDPKTVQPIPALAERWEIGANVDEFVFHLRKNGRWSNGDAITARDFVYSLRRGFDPDVLSRTANLGYYIKNAKAVHSGSMYVRKNAEFLLERDFAADEAAKPAERTVTLGTETEFNRFLKSPQRLIAAGTEKERAKEAATNPKLKAAFENAEFVLVPATDLGVEAIDDYTLRITLSQPAPFFIGMLAHQFFRLVPQKTIEAHGKNWTKPENIVTNGPFKIKEHSPYHQLVVERDPMHWDAANVKLDGIKFYPSEEQTTMLNLYKAGDVDATYNHTVPTSWIENMREYHDEYLNFPEIASEFYVINTQKPPMTDVRVRQAFSLAVDREALGKFKKTSKPQYNFTPDGAFLDYEAARARVTAGSEKRNQFDPERARKLLAEAGFPVVQNNSGFACPNFPTDKVGILYNTNESNKATAEFLQAQWKQNLGITVSLKNQETKTWLVDRNQLQYSGFSRSGWVGDYLDPFTFLGLHYTADNEGATGWHDPKYDALLDEANRTADPTKRYELMAQAETYLLDQHIVLPLLTTATNWIKKPYVKGMYPNPGTLHAWKYVYIERDPAKWDANVENIMK